MIGFSSTQMINRFMSILNFFKRAGFEEVMKYVIGILFSIGFIVGFIMGLVPIEIFSSAIYLVLGYIFGNQQSDKVHRYEIQKMNRSNCE